MDGISIISNNSKSEERIWLKLSAKFFGFDKDVFIYSLYISPQRSSHIASMAGMIYGGCYKMRS